MLELKEIEDMAGIDSPPEVDNVHEIINEPLEQKEVESNRKLDYQVDNSKKISQEFRRKLIKEVEECDLVQGLKTLKLQEVSELKTKDAFEYFKKVINKEIIDQRQRYRGKRFKELGSAQ